MFEFSKEKSSHVFFVIKLSLSLVHLNHSSSFYSDTRILASLPSCPSAVLPSYHQDQAHTAVGGGSGPAGCVRGAPGPSRGSGDEGRTEAGADSHSWEGSRSPQSTGPATRPGWMRQCCNIEKKHVRIFVKKITISCL